MEFPEDIQVPARVEGTDSEPETRVYIIDHRAEEFILSLPLLWRRKPFGAYVNPFSLMLF